MTAFSFKHLQKITAGKTGYALDLAVDYGEAKSLGGLASSASSFLNTATACIWTGLDEPARQLLEKSRKWLEDATANNERPPRYFPHATEAQRIYDLATCRWLIDGIQPSELLKQSIAAREQWFDSQRKIDKTSFVMTVHQYLDAGAYAQMMQRISQVWPDGRRPLEIDVASQAVVPNLDRNRVENLYPQRMAEWLGAGRYLDAACWLKVGLWVADSSRSPFDIVREARKYAL